MKRPMMKKQDLTAAAIGRWFQPNEAFIKGNLICRNQTQFFQGVTAERQGIIEFFLYIVLTDNFSNFYAEKQNNIICE